MSIAYTETKKFLKGRKHLTPHEETLEWLGIKQSRIEKIRTGLYKREIQANGYPIDTQPKGFLSKAKQFFKNFFNRKT